MTVSSTGKTSEIAGDRNSDVVVSEIEGFTLLEKGVRSEERCVGKEC